MTTRPEEIDVKCPKCGESYKTWRRASFNLTLGEDFDEKYMHDMTHATCPKCGTEVDLGALTVSREGEFQVRKGSASTRGPSKR